jgi:3',5'-cyclic AMP phosphodiesterase CpdA
MKFIHLSDTHIQKKDFQLYGLDPYLQLELAIKSINKTHKDASFVVITGDLTEDGEVKSYRKLKKIIKKSKVEVILLMGNHDNRENFLKVFKDSPINEGYIQECRIFNDKAFIFLDTLVYGTHSGDMDNSQFEWLDKQLKKHTLKDTFIFMHHPPIKSGIPIMDKMRFKSHKKLKSLINLNPQIKYLFFGHIHRIISGVWSGIPYFGIRGTNHQLSLKYSTTHQYTTNEEKAAYGIINIDEQDIVINVHEYLDEDKCYLIEE